LLPSYHRIISKIMKGSLKIARIAGIDVFLHWTFALLLVYILFVNYRAGSTGSELLWSIAFILTIFFIIVLHELGHALTARRFNIKTKGITLLPIGGVAQLERMPDKPKEELLVALAGPAVNVVLAGLLFFFVPMPATQEEATRMMSSANAQNFLFQLFYVNVALALFNMIPAFPMDGGRVLRAILAMRMDRMTATLIAARIGQGLAVVFMIMGIISNPFLIFVGLFVIMGAQAEAEQARATYLLKDATVGEVAMDNYAVIQQEDTIGTAVNKLLHAQGHDFIVFHGREVVGTLVRDQIIDALANSGKDIPVKEVMNPTFLRFSPHESLEKAWRDMTEANATIAIVFRGEGHVGMVDAENIMEYIMVKSAMNLRNRRLGTGKRIGHSPSMG
jgi:Zn-dependent protease/predicted transcriptional regulator